MKTIKVVIEIDEDVYKAHKMGDVSPWIVNSVFDAVRNGEPILSFFEKLYEKIEKERKNKWQQALDQNCQRITNTGFQDTDFTNSNTSSCSIRNGSSK